MNNNQLSQGELLKKIFTRVIIFIAFLFAMFFLPAGTFAYWEAWVYLTLILVSMFSFLIYFLKNDTGLLERRMRAREKESKQKLIVVILSLCFILTFLLPGFDKRFEWSAVPAAVVIVADILVFLGYGMTFLALRENSYASRIIEVEQGQKVISSGLYAIVRHPMYLGALLMFLFTPLALGSYWAMIPSLLMIPIFMARIRNEEKVLESELEGYLEYMQKTKYRVIPGIW